MLQIKLFNLRTATCLSMATYLEEWKLSIQTSLIPLKNDLVSHHVHMGVDYLSVNPKNNSIFVIFLD